MRAAWALACLCLVTAIPASAQAVNTLDAPRALLVRVLGPSAAERFQLESIPADGGHDVFEVSPGPGGTIILRGNTGVSIASALHHYLKTSAHVYVSWEQATLVLPDPLPTPAQAERRTTPHQYRAFFNPCTFSYSAPWWTWAEWQRVIDVMAMNGINLPLALVGTEGVWYYTLRDQGFTDAEARQFLSAPSFLSWQWMANLEGAGGPLSRAWIEEHLTLGRRILDRERELGMTPIVQGFSGFVPRLLQEKHPDAAIRRQGRWFGFAGTAVIDPRDPLFAAFGLAFLEQSARLLGSAGFYLADPFHENDPPIYSDTYMRATGVAIDRLLKQAAPHATWAMQSWSLREPIITAAPHDDVLVLDLGGWDGYYYGYRYVQGELHNFGGRTNLHGDLAAMALNPFALEARADSDCVGMGLFMEGLGQNAVFYDLVLDLIWRDGGVALGPWLEDRARRRYGHPSASAARAWALLAEGPYGPNTSGVESSSVVAMRPALRFTRTGPDVGFERRYDTRRLADALDQLLVDANRLAPAAGYQDDVVDLARQLLSNLAEDRRRRVTTAYDARDARRFTQDAAAFHRLLADLDRLLATRPQMRLDTWLDAASAWGRTPDEEAAYRSDAAWLLTLWGPDAGNGNQLFDYAWREWAGLIADYYLPRWQRLDAVLAQSLATSQRYAEAPEGARGRPELRASPFLSGLADWERAFAAHPPDAHPARPDDAVAMTRRLLQQYRRDIKAMYP